MLLQIHAEQGRPDTGITMVQEWYGTVPTYPAAVTVLVARLHVKRRQMEAAKVCLINNLRSLIK